jgi:cell division protein FtsB
LSKAANIYWDSPDIRERRQTERRTNIRRRTAKAAPAPRRAVPWWCQFAIAVSIFLMLGVAINYRAFTEMRQEAGQNGKLASQIENLMDENLALQEEIHSLKTDPTRIQMEAKRIGVVFSGQDLAVSNQQSAVRKLKTEN